MEEIIRNRAIVSKVLLFEAFIVVLAGFVGKAIPPRSGGVPYVKEK